MSNMETTKTASLSLSLPAYSQLICNYDERNAALWYYMNPKPRPCFTPTLLNEIRDLQNRVRQYIQSSSEAKNSLHYLIKASAVPEIFNLGGDLKLFVRLIAERDRDAMFKYGQVCVDVVYGNATNLGIPSLTTISLIQGSALGGGLEAALAQNIVIAEENVQLGFPEILFNLFPGMGAYSLLARRLDAIKAERLITSGLQYSAATLAEMGAIDVAAKKGQGIHAVNEFIRNHSRARNGYQAIKQAVQRVHPLPYKELMDVVEIWVDAALRLTTRDLRMMTKLVAAQERLDVLDQPEQAPAAHLDRNVEQHASADRRIAGAFH